MVPVPHRGLRAAGRALLPALCSGLILAGACAQETGPIKIGVSANFADVNMAPMLDGARLAVAEINAKGGINGRLLELVERDDREDPDSAVVVATELYHDPGIVAVLGNGFSGLTLAAAPVYNGGDNPVVQISPTASAPAVSQAGPYTFRMCPSDLAHGGALARWARDGLGFQRGVVLYGNDDYGRGVQQSFMTEFAAIDGQILTADPYLGSPPEVGPYLDRIVRSGRAEFILLAGYLDEAEYILAEARSRGITIPFMGGDGIERIERQGALAEGTYVTAAYMSLIDTPRNNQFVESWAVAYPGQAPPNLSAAGAYDAVYLVSQAIAEVGTDRTAIRDAIAALGTSRPAFQGVLGTIGFDANGDVTAPVVYVGVVRNGVVELAGENQ
ncbi:MAG: ABC transporter substrate-binding protein [Gemmatimonadetes bacterium]|nr:ABC transporter substrate-binding protein [Gemmatimonadota bacterium]